MKVGGDGPAACLAPFPSRPPHHAVPAGSWDVHAHVIGAPPRHPWVFPRNYDPPPATVDDYVSLLDTLGLDHGVLVQVSVHGTDNRLLLDGLAAHAGRLRGVVAVGLDVTDTELDRLHAAGVRGVRIATVVAGGVPLKAATALGARIARLGWHVEFALHGDMLVDAAPMLRGFPVPIVIAHFGDCDVAAGVGGPQFRALAGLVEHGHCHVKLSAAYRLAPCPWSDVGAFAAELLRIAPERMLWGSDWPHVALTDPAAMPRTEALLDLLAHWSPDPAVRRQLLVDNPRRLYGLPAPRQSIHTP